MRHSLTCQNDFFEIRVYVPFFRGSTEYAKEKILIVVKKDNKQLLDEVEYDIMNYQRKHEV